MYCTSEYCCRSFCCFVVPSGSCELPAFLSGEQHTRGVSSVADRCDSYDCFLCVPAPPLGSEVGKRAGRQGSQW